MENQIKAISELAEEILNKGAYKATKFFKGLDAKDTTVKVTRKLYKGRFSRKVIELLVTIGPPNYEERNKIKQAKKLGFGLVEMTVKYPPKKGGKG